VAHLLAQAKRLENASSIDQALALVAQAKALLEESAPDSVQRGRVLDYEAFLVMTKAQMNGTISQGHWREEVLPLASEALRILESNRAGEDDLATALETKAEALGTSEQAKPLRTRAAKIRRELVQERLRADNPKPCLQADTKPGTLTAKLLPDSSTAVTLSFVVNKQGSVEDIKLIRSAGFGLDERAAEAVRCWRFTPAMSGGHPVAVPATVKINFRLAWSVDAGTASERSGEPPAADSVRIRVHLQ
jgi:TonB family protein